MPIMLNFIRPQKAFKVKQWPALYKSNQTALDVLSLPALSEAIFAM